MGGGSKGKNHHNGSSNTGSSKSKCDDDDDEANRILTHQLAQLGLRQKDIVGDGNCLFRSLADQMCGDQARHFRYRTAVCEHIAARRALYEPFAIDEPLDAQLARMAKDGTYGGNQEVVAFARAFGVDVAIHQPGSPVWIVRGCEDDGVDDKPNAKDGPARLVHIIYHSWEHYSSVRNIRDEVFYTDGSPKIVIRPQALEPLAERPADAPPSSMERMIMSTMGTDDLSKIRQMLKEARGDPGRVIERLYEEQEREAALEADADADGGVVGDGHEKAAVGWNGFRTRRAASRGGGCGRGWVRRQRRRAASQRRGTRRRRR
ncbi:hypothetical protein DFJ73DRAFT_528098 [Zopfochytrium polystomum]|nr:hypothetical protein DFJ73DRAFT_528098 [Zopfochytrium polystomum]